MRLRTWAIVGALTAGTVLAAASVAQPYGPRTDRARLPVSRTSTPVVVELFTSQGCGGCVDANKSVERLADEPGVIALTYGVDYWDYLGWNDTFAQPAFTERQRAYRAPLQQRNVSTPQVVIDGRRQVSGARNTELETAVVEEASRQVWAPEIEFRETGHRVGIGSGRAPAGGADVLAVTYTPGVQVVEPREGENRGREVRHMNVVRDVVRLGDWRGRAVLYPLPEHAEGDAIAILVQGKSDRRILGAAVGQ